MEGGSTTVKRQIDLNANPHAEHPRDVPNLLARESLATPAENDADPSRTESASASEHHEFNPPKPLTPREKMKAITCAADVKPSNTNRGTMFTAGHDIYRHVGCLPIAHRASKAPATQTLELRHGQTSLRNVAVA